MSREVDYSRRGESREVCGGSCIIEISPSISQCLVWVKFHTYHGLMNLTDITLLETYPVCSHHAECFSIQIMLKSMLEYSAYSRQEIDCGSQKIGINIFQINYTL